MKNILAWLRSDVVPENSLLRDLYPGKVWHYVATIAASVMAGAAIIAAECLL